MWAKINAGRNGITALRLAVKGGTWRYKMVSGQFHGGFIRGKKTGIDGNKRKGMKKIRMDSVRQSGLNAFL